MTGPVEKVLLLGMMGAGKTTVGTALASRLGWTYLDNDALLQRSTGQTGPELLAHLGSDGLRAAESSVLTLLLAMPGPLVGGVPGGVVLDAADRARLVAAADDGCLVVWLRASPAVLARRVGSGAGRARLGDDPAGALRHLAEVRDPLYAEVAGLVLDADTAFAGTLGKRLAEQVAASRG